MSHHDPEHCLRVISLVLLGTGLTLWHTTDDYLYRLSWWSIFLAVIVMGVSQIQRHIEFVQHFEGAVVVGPNGVCAPRPNRQQRRLPLQKRVKKAPDLGSNTCVICLDEKAVYALVPCGHVCLGIACCRTALSRCPLCRANVQSVLELF